MEEKEIIVKNLKANFKIIGIGKPILILHGWQSNSERWQPVAEILSANYTVIIPDLPGFGKSEEPKIAWSLDNYVDWLQEFTQKIPELNNDEFILMGHSFGGALAAKFAIKYNQKVKKLVLVSAACIRKNTSVKKVFYRLAKISKILAFLPFYNLLRKAFYKFVIRKSDYIYQEGVMKETYLKVILEDLSYKLNFIKLPVLIIWGDKDESTPIDQARFINQKIMHSQLEVITGADHSLHIKMPKVLTEIIMQNVL